MTASGAVEHSYSFSALGTYWHVLTPSRKLTVSQKKKIATLVKDFEQDYSRFLPDSFVGTLNREKVLKKPNC